MWIFLKPLSWKLWLTTLVAFFGTGFMVWILEHRINTEFRGPPDQQFSTAFWFSFSILVFAHSNIPFPFLIFYHVNLYLIKKMNIIVCYDKELRFL